jgi:hypothetical protein
MDDFIAFDSEKAKLDVLKSKIARFCYHELKLELKESGTFMAPVTQGISFLGFRIFPGVIRLKHENRISFQRNFRYKEKAYLLGKIDETEFIRSAVSMLGHIKHANTLNMRKKLFFDPV